MTRDPALAKLSPIAEDQWGLLTRRQAEKAGIPPATLARLTAEGTVLRRVAHGVYRLGGAPPPDHEALRAAWLQLEPDVPAWQRTPEQGVVSHRSAAALYELGELPADVHEFTVSRRRQSRRKDVRLHRRKIGKGQVLPWKGMPTTLPAQTASDLLYEHEDPEAVARIIVEAIRRANDYPGTIAQAIAPHAAQFGLRRGDGLALFRWLVGLVGDPEADQWMREAREHFQWLDRERSEAGVASKGSAE
jgi:predicted transcriptional regulator of viral defense system